MQSGFRLYNFQHVARWDTLVKCRLACSVLQFPAGRQTLNVHQERHRYIYLQVPPLSK
jgi:hypothetical protein